MPKGSNSSFEKKEYTWNSEFLKSEHRAQKGPTAPLKELIVLPCGAYFHNGYASPQNLKKKTAWILADHVFHSPMATCGSYCVASCSTCCDTGWGRASLMGRFLRWNRCTKRDFTKIDLNNDWFDCHLNGILTGQISINARAEWATDSWPPWWMSAWGLNIKGVHGSMTGLFLSKMEVILTHSLISRVMMTHDSYSFWYFLAETSRLSRNISLFMVHFSPTMSSRLSIYPKLIDKIQELIGEITRTRQTHRQKKYDQQWWLSSALFPHSWLLRWSSHTKQ